MRISRQTTCGSKAEIYSGNEFGFLVATYPSFIQVLYATECSLFNKCAQRSLYVLFYELSRQYPFLTRGLQTLVFGLKQQSLGHRDLDHGVHVVLLLVKQVHWAAMDLKGSTWSDANCNKQWSESPLQYVESRSSSVECIRDNEDCPRLHTLDTSSSTSCTEKHLG